MRRDVVNGFVRVRRDLRFRLADRYRALLASRFAVLAALAAGVVDRATSAGVVARRLRARNRTTPHATGVVVRAAVTGGDELSLVVRDAPVGATAVTLRRATTTHTLPTTLDRGALLRLVATLPDTLRDGDEWTVGLAGAMPLDLNVDDPAALRVRLPRRTRSRGDDGLRVDAGRLLLRASAPTTGIEHRVEVGIRSAIVTWPQPSGPADLVLVCDDAERAFPARVENGVARAVIDLSGLGADDATWFAFATGRVPLLLSRDAFPPLDDTGRPHRVPLPTGGATGRAVEVGYSPDNQLVVRVGNFAPAAS